METTFSFTDDIFKTFKKEGNFWVTTIDCVVVLGIRGVKVRAIKNAIKNKLNRQRRGFHRGVLELFTVVANRYARTFLSRREFGPLNKQEVERFKVATQKIISLSQKTEIEASTLIKELMYCLSREYTEKGETVKIGHLSSDYTWNVLFPQHLKQVIPGYSER